MGVGGERPLAWPAPTWEACLRLPAPGTLMREQPAKARLPAGLHHLQGDQHMPKLRKYLAANGANFSDFIANFAVRWASWPQRQGRGYTQHVRMCMGSQR